MTRRVVASAIAIAAVVLISSQVVVFNGRVQHDIKTDNCVWEIECSSRFEE